MKTCPFGWKLKKQSESLKNCSVSVILGRVGLMETDVLLLRPYLTRTVYFGILNNTGLM